MHKLTKVLMSAFILICYLSLVGQTEPCSDKTDVIVSITVDSMPGEIDYRIILDKVAYPNAFFVSRLVDWESLPPDTTINGEFNLLDGCHDFIITDSGGNGLCCENGNGSYKLTIDGIVIASGSNFAAADTMTFCTTAPTCSDGIQNGGETGVDCGGCCTPCAVTCDDGIQNGDETGIDCGGSFCATCSECAASETETTVSITLDNYPAETSWEILDDNNNSILTGGNYGNIAPLTTVDTTVCITNGCYLFNMFDSFGDGICCLEGDGSFSVTVGGNLVVTGGQFGSFSSNSFCTNSCFDGIQNGDETGVDCGGTSCAPCGPPCIDNLISVETIFDDYPEDISWQIKDATSNGIVASSTTYGQNAGVSAIEVACLADGCYEFTINDSYGDGLCCTYGEGSYSVVFDGQNITSGAEFTDTESYSFCLFNSTISTCSDGIQNGDETGIDCGGSCVPCCSTQLTFDDFENGFGNWNDGGNDCFRSANQTNAASGTHSIRIRDNSGIPSSMFSNNLDVSSVDQLRVDFTYRAVGMENGEDFWLQYSSDGGLTWQTVETWTRGVDFQNKQFMNEQVYLDVSSAASADLRFINDASANNDKIFIDDVGVYSCESAGAKGVKNNSSSAAFNDVSTRTDSRTLEDNTVLKRNLSSVKSKLYPNPTKDVVNIKYNLLHTNRVEISIVDISGKVVKSLPQGVQDKGDYTLSVNMTSHDPGVYIMTVHTEEETMIHRFIVIR